MTDTANTNAAARLSEFNMIVLLDASGSMMEPAKANNPNGPTRWDYVQESTMGIVRQMDKIDADGIDLVIFRGNDASNIVTHNNVTASKLSEIFKTTNPGSRTPTAEALKIGFDLAAAGGKKAFLFAITDGEPNDQAAVARVITEQANKQETDDQCTVLFLQAGDDAGATKFLKNLDDNLKGAKFDIVDVKTVEEADNYSSAVDLIMEAIAD